jgi:PleD family two-component response regulator
MADVGPGGGDQRASLRPVGEKPVRILIVDDEAGVRSALSRILRNAGMVPAATESGTAAL